MSLQILFQIKLLLLMTKIHHGWHSTWNLKWIDVTVYIKNTTGKEVSADDFIFLENMISEVWELIFNIKNVCYNQLAQKLNDPKTSSKIYWSTLETFYNIKEVPLIPLLFINNKLELVLCW